MSKKIVIGWRCGCSKTSSIVDEINNKISKISNSKFIYSAPTINTCNETAKRINKVTVFNSRSKSKVNIINNSNGNNWKAQKKINELIQNDNHIVLTHAYLQYKDPSDCATTNQLLHNNMYLYLDEFACKLKKVFIQTGMMRAYLNPYTSHISIPKYITYDNEEDLQSKRKENDWLSYRKEYDNNDNLRVHKIHISKKLIDDELKRIFPAWYGNDYKLNDRELTIYRNLCVTYRRTYAYKNQTEVDVDDYSRWLWLTPNELKDNGIDLFDIIGTKYSMFDNYQYRWEGQLYSKLRDVYEISEYQKFISYIMLLITKMIAKDQYYNVDWSDRLQHAGYYMMMINPLERWFVQNVFNVICLDGSATIMKDIYKHYGFELIDDEEKSITHYADNLEYHLFNIKGFTQSSIANMKLSEVKRIIDDNFTRYSDKAKRWYVVVPSKLTDVFYNALEKLYGKNTVCDCSNQGRWIWDNKLNDYKQISIKQCLREHSKAKYILVNHEGQIGSNEFLNCDGVLVLSQINIPKNIELAYNNYYDITNYNNLYSVHTIYQESARAKNRLDNTKLHNKKIPFIAIVGMNKNQYETFITLGSDTIVFKLTSEEYDELLKRQINKVNKRAKANHYIIKLGNKEFDISDYDYTKEEIKQIQQLANDANEGKFNNKEDFLAYVNCCL